jgi:hypothetical protein
MTVDLMTTEQPCAFCTKGKVVFLVKSEVYTGRICASHLAGLLTQEKSKPGRADQPSLPEIANGELVTP